MDSYYWRLCYADDSVMDEPDDNASVFIAKPNPVALMVTNNQRTPLIQIPLEKNEHPVFYRKRSMSTHLNDARTDAIVFGKGWETDTKVDGKLWAIINDKISDCPQWAISPEAIKNLVMEKI